MSKQRFDTHNVEGWTSSKGDTLTIHIYGSGKFTERDLSENDWLRTNFVAVPLGGVHLGYLTAAIRVFRLLLPQITDAERVLVTGHSMGGGVAEVLGAVIELVTSKPTTTHNFGGPASFGRFRRSRLAWHLVDAHWYSVPWDFVTWLPPWNRHIGTRHAVPCDIKGFTQRHVHGYTLVMTEVWASD